MQLSINNEIVKFKENTLQYFSAWEKGGLSQVSFKAVMSKNIDDLRSWSSKLNKIVIVYNDKIVTDLINCRVACERDEETLEMPEACTLNLTDDEFWVNFLGVSSGEI